MIVQMVHIIILVICYTHVQASPKNVIIAKRGCDPQCGGVEIPYPFGMNNASNCSADEWFEIECRNNTTPYLKSLGVQVTSIDVFENTVDIMNPIYRSNCGKKNAQSHIKPRRGSPFVYSPNYNKLVGVGCNNIALLQSNGEDVSGCVSICDNDDDDITNFDLKPNKCHGKSCCFTSLPSHLSEYSIKIEPLKKNQKGPHCSYAMIILQPDSEYITSKRNKSYNFVNGGNLKDLNVVPVVLEWEILNSNSLTHKIPADEYATCQDTNVTSSQYKHSGQRCTCSGDPFGYESYNPYLAGGCPPDVSVALEVESITINGTVVDISEIVDTTYFDKSTIPRRVVIITAIFGSFGSIILTFALWRLYQVVRKNIEKKRQEKFFKRNGGLLLEQRLSSGEVNVDKVKHFSLRDLEKATDHFNNNRVLGKGGQGTVYKGMLIDGKIIAVKKFKVQGHVEQFINEFVILSQINHRNVVKLLGCCLETEIPLLVYEFIPNGNLFEYLHGENEDLPMTWDMRLRIAAEVAGALFYLHSVASQPIYHRDIKSTNILLDEKYRAKVADFGASRMVSIEATHLTTAVQGTFGYLDPEYFRNSQFTEKSDVYSFGVVLVELLTRQKPISSLGLEETRSLASYFIQCMEESNLFDIIDEEVRKEGKKEDIIAIANLASRCLELNGRKRPTMKEITFELESIRKLEGKSNSLERYNELDLVSIQNYQSWAEDTTTISTRSSLYLNSRAPSLEDIHILTI